MVACLAGRNGTTFEDCYHDYMHSSAPRLAVNYATCLLCGGEMLRDSASNICSRSLCKAVRVMLQKQLGNRQ